jgi:hypothetical protein
LQLLRSSLASWYWVPSLAALSSTVKKSSLRCPRITQSKSFLFLQPIFPSQQQHQGHLQHRRKNSNAMDQSLFLAINHLPHTVMFDALAGFLSGIGQWGAIWFLIAVILFFREEKRDHWFFLPTVLATVLSLTMFRNTSQVAGSTTEAYGGHWCHNPNISRQLFVSLNACNDCLGDGVRAFARGAAASRVVLRISIFYFLIPHLPGRSLSD